MSADSDDSTNFTFERKFIRWGSELLNSPIQGTSPILLINALGILPGKLIGAGA
jgi:hypothetical protein